MRRLVYHPIVSYPDPATDDSLLRAIEMASLLGADLQATAFALDVPSISNPLGGLLTNVPEMVRAAEEKSRRHCQRLTEALQRAADAAGVTLVNETRPFAPDLIGDAAAKQARYFDLALLVWSKDNVATQELAEGVIFGSGRPSILLPEQGFVGKVDHVAVAWDASRVAARALGDALTLLSAGTRVTVLTVSDEKPLPGMDIAETLAATLGRRGLKARANPVESKGRPIAVALQEQAVEAGAQLMVMGGYGHSRLREFVLGGATRGVLADLRLPVLLSH